MGHFTEIVCVIDKSGSMAPLQQDAIGGFNTFLEGQKALPSRANLTLVLFDTDYLVVHDGVPIAEAQPLTEATYVPGGMTALYDAVARTIDSVGVRLAAMPEEERPEHVIMAILTDGQENSSQEFAGPAGAEAVRARIEHQRDKYGWEFVFLAANQDAVVAGGRMGIAPDRTAHFDASPHGVERAFLMQRAAAESVRGRGVLRTDWAKDPGEDEDEGKA